MTNLIDFTLNELVIKIKSKEIGADVILDMEIEGKNFKSTLIDEKIETSLVTEVNING